MFIIIETLHDQSLSFACEDSLQTTSYWVPRDRSHDVSLVLVSFTLIYSATCAFNSIVVFTLMFAPGYMCFVKL